MVQGRSNTLGGVVPPTEAPWSPTISRALISSGEGRWRTLFASEVVLSGKEGVGTLNFPGVVEIEDSKRSPVTTYIPVKVLTTKAEKGLGGAQRGAPKCIQD